MPLLEVRNLKKVYTTRFGANQVQALSDVSFSVEEGEYVAIMGESGSGKTTLLNILAALDKPTSGDVLLNGQKHHRHQGRGDLPRSGGSTLGFVFQDFNLLDTFSIEDNIFLPLVLSRQPHKVMQQRLAPIAQKLGIGEILQKYPYEVSGGQKQRAAVARALITEPADYPGRRADRRAGLQGGNETAADAPRHQLGRADHPHGHPQHPGCQPCGQGAVYQGRRGIPPDLQRADDKRRAVPENFRHPDGADDGREKP